MNYKETAIQLSQLGAMHPEWGNVTLAMWLRDECRCVYCDRELLQSRDLAYYIARPDHLLPRVKYPYLEIAEWNVVLACASCNSLKAQWDPNNDGPVLYTGQLVPTPEVTAELIERCRRYLNEKRAKAEVRFHDQVRLIRGALNKAAAAA